MGDLNGDFRNDHADFALFKTAFETSNGAGSFASGITQVPEPASALLSIWITFAGISSRKGAKRKDGTN